MTCFFFFCHREWSLGGAGYASGHNDRTTTSGSLELGCTDLPLGIHNSERDRVYFERIEGLRLRMAFIIIFHGTCLCEQCTIGIERFGRT